MLENLSNYTILKITACLFSVFVTGEIIGALVSNSLSLLADASSMSIDVFSYLTNIYVEYVVNKGDSLSKNMTLFLFAGVPLFSLVALLAVTIWIVAEAIAVILNPPDSSSVDIYVMFGFASFNMLVDLLSLSLFYKNYDSALLNRQISRRSTSISAIIKTPNDGDADRMRMLSKSVLHQVNFSDKSDNYNLNMLSAAAHVYADSLRTIAVFASALSVQLGAVHNSDIADAWAALVCSITIILAMIPIVMEIINAFRRYLSNDLDIYKGLLEEESKFERNSVPVPTA